MPAADSTRSDDTPPFRSPKRALARSFRLSRDRWKEKATQRRTEIKTLKIRIRDLQVSRDLWKEKALHLQRQLDELLGLVSPQQEDDPDTQPSSPNAPDVSSDPPAEAVCTSVPDQLPLLEAATSLDQPPLTAAVSVPSPDQPPSTPAAAQAATASPLTVPPAATTEAPEAKKTVSGAAVILGARPSGQRVPGAHSELDRIWLAMSCILSGKVSLQAVPRLLEVFDNFYQLGQSDDIPDWTTSRMWLMRLGLGQLRLPVIKADDWVLWVDHSVQLGRDRCLAVLGGRLSELPCGPLHREDLRLLHLKAMRDPNMHSNHQELVKVVQMTGPPRAVVSDHGADLSGGVRLLRESSWQNRGILDIYDIKHRTAVALKHRLEDNPRWLEFISQIGKTRNAAKQTEWAFLLPPVLRSKSRYLNLGELVRWGVRTNWLIEHKPKALLEHGEVARLEEKLGWLQGFTPDLELWRGWYQVAARTEQAVRNLGLYRGAEADLEKRLSPVAKEATSKDMAAEMVAFVKEQSKGLKEGEKLPGSTQVLESCFGTLKALEKDQSRCGFTGLVLGLGALLGKVTKEVVRQALAKTPIKAVLRWCEENIGETLQSKRRQVYRLAGATDLG